MTPRWKEDVRKWMDSEKLTVPQLATVLHVDRKAVWQMLQPKQQTSSLVDPICELSGIDPPLVAGAKDDLDRFVDRLTPDERLRAAAILRAALGDRLDSK